jgi:hypothetical protein
MQERAIRAARVARSRLEISSLRQEVDVYGDAIGWTHGP